MGLWNNLENYVSLASIGAIIFAACSLESYAKERWIAKPTQTTPTKLSQSQNGTQESAAEFVDGDPRNPIDKPDLSSKAEDFTQIDDNTYRHTIRDGNKERVTRFNKTCSGLEVTSMEELTHIGNSVTDTNEWNTAAGLESVIGRPEIPIADYVSEGSHLHTMSQLFEEVLNETDINGIDYVFDIRQVRNGYSGKGYYLDRYHIDFTASADGSIQSLRICESLDRDTALVFNHIDFYTRPGEEIGKLFDKGLKRAIERRSEKDKLNSRRRPNQDHCRRN